MMVEVPKHDLFPVQNRNRNRGPPHTNDEQNFSICVLTSPSPWSAARTCMHKETPWLWTKQPHTHTDTHI